MNIQHKLKIQTKYSLFFYLKNNNYNYYFLMNIQHKLKIQTKYSLFFYLKNNNYNYYFLKNFMFSN
jgi:hypothetical protein